MGGLLSRMQNVVVGAVDSALGAAERASAPALLRGAARDAASAVERVRKARGVAEDRVRALDAEIAAAQRNAAELGEKARYAITKNRADLAAAAIGAQIDHEQAAARLGGERQAAVAEIKRLGEEIAALDARRETMAGEVAATARATPTGARSTRRAQQAMERAEEAFERAATAHGAMTRAAADVRAIDGIARDEAIAARLAAMQAKAPAPAAKKRRSRG